MDLRPPRNDTVGTQRNPRRSVPVTIRGLDGPTRGPSGRAPGGAAPAEGMARTKGVLKTMSHSKSSTRSWSLWGVLLLIIPAMFVIGALAGHNASVAMAHVKLL